MEKLTKEQAEGLIEHIKSHYHVYCPKCTINCNVASDKYLETVINQCTEKEFPEFECTYGSNLELKVSNPFHDKDCIQVDLQQGEDDNSFQFSAKEFEEFARGVNEIIKWLEEQE